MGERVVSVVRKGAAIEAILHETDLIVKTVCYSHLSQYLSNKSAVKQVQATLELLQADLILVRKQSDLKMAKEVAGITISKSDCQQYS